MMWNEYDQQIRKLGNIIYDGNFKPDMIIAIARGGWIFKIEKNNRLFYAPIHSS